jgi:hypothetical protein
MHNWDEPLTREECRKFFISDALCWKAAQQCRGHQHDPDFRVCQALVDCTEQRHAEANVLLAEPDPHTTRLQKVVKFLGRALPVVPRVA